MTDALNELRKICLTLPDSIEGVAWGHPVWRAGEAMLAGYEEVASIADMVLESYRISAPRRSLAKLDALP